MRTPSLLAVCLLAAMFPAGVSAQERIRVGVVDVDYRAVESGSNKAYRAFGRRELDSDTRAFTDMLITSLVRTQKFDVIERDRMASILKEQGLGEFGITNIGGGMSLEGLDYLVTGSITEYGVTESGGSFGGFGTKRKTARMAVDIRVIDADNGLTRIAESVSVKEDGSRSLSLSGDNLRSGGSEGAVLGQVMRKASREITFLVVEEVFPVRVVTVTDSGELILNYGDGLLAPEDRLDIYREGESFVDPATGETLGSEKTFVATVEVTRAESKFSRATIINSVEAVAAGMVAAPAAKEKREAAQRRKIP